MRQMIAIFKRREKREILLFLLTFVITKSSQLSLNTKETLLYTKSATLTVILINAIVYIKQN